MPNIFQKIFIKKGPPMVSVESIPYIITSPQRGVRAQKSVDEYVKQWSQHHIYRAIDFLARAIQKKDWHLEQDGEPLPETATRAKRYYQLFHKPNEYNTWRTFIYLIVAAREATGNAYLLPFGDTRKPEKLYFIPPNKCKIITSDTQAIAGYQTTINGSTMNLTRDLILHLRYPDINDPQGYGIGPYQAAKDVYNQYDYITLYANTLMENIGVPPIVLQWGNTPDQSQRLLTKWIEATAGFRNAGKTHAIPKDANIIKNAFSPSEIDFSGMKKEVKEEVYEIFGVPGVLINPKGATFSNMYQARLAVEENKIQPILTDIAEFFTQHIILEPSIHFKFDMSMPKDPKFELEQRKVYLQNNVISRNEVRAEHGRLPYSGGDDVFMEAGKVVIGSVATQKPKKSSGSPHVKIYNFYDTGLRSWKNFIQWQDPLEKEFRDVIDGYFLWLGKEVAKNVRKLAPKSLDEVKKDEGDHALSDMVLVSLAIMQEKMQGLFDPIVERTLMLSFTQKISELGASTNVLNIDEYMKLYISKLEETWQGIAATDVKQLKRLIQEGLSEDMTMNQIARYVGNRYNPTANDYMNRGRSFTISRTETGRAANTLSHDTIQGAGVPSRGWFTALDEKVRDAHMAAHGQIQQIEKPFLVGGEFLLFPGDPAGSAENVICCRCIEVPQEILEV